MKAELMETLVVGPVLTAMARYDPRMDTPAARTLMLGTIAQESDFALYNRQIKGPALGICQVEPATEKWIRTDYLPRKPELQAMMNQFLPDERYDTDEWWQAQLEFNWHYCVYIARLKYWTIPQPLPQSLMGIAHYWDTHYNANPDYGTPGEFMDAYRKYVGMD